VVKRVMICAALGVTAIAFSGCAGWSSSAGITTNEGPRADHVSGR